MTAPIEQPHVGLVIDTSGSMSAYEYALGPICWILTDALRQVDGRLATALFGNSASLLSDGTQRMRLVPGDPDGRRDRVRRRRDRARLRAAGDDQPAPPPLRLRAVRRRLVSDTQAGVQRIRWLADHDVPTIHLSIGIEPLGGGVRPHPRHHRPRPGARPDRRRHRRRADGRDPPAAHPDHHLTKETRMPHPDPATRNAALAPVAGAVRRHPGRAAHRRRRARARRARGPRARPQPAPPALAGEHPRRSPAC